MKEDLRAGYKRTEVGVIPEGWSVGEIGDFNPFVTSGSRGWAEFYSDRGNAFIRITNMSRESIYLDLSDLKLVNLPQNETEGSRTELQNGDILISITADIGIISYVSEWIPKPAYINQHIALVRFDASKAHSRFIGYFLASENAQRHFRNTTDIGAKAGINLLTVRRIKLALPPIGEQKAIAEALSDVDALIGALGRLIEKKRNIKQAAMQRLLSGQHRLPGFGGEWEVKRLGEVLKVCHGKSQHHVVADGGLYPILATGGEIGRTNNWMYDKPSVLIGRKGTIDAPRYVESPFWTIDTLFYTEITNRADVKFIFYMFNTIKWRNYNEASGVPSLNGSTIEGIEIPLPPLPEQKAIAQVLSDMDAELQALDTRLQKTKCLKQGMMQELLTGKTRLPAKDSWCSYEPNS